MYDSIIFVGIWRDYEYPWTKGLYLTLTTNGFTVFVAVLAIWITVTGSRSWKICRFILHQTRPHHQARDAMIREHETVLRQSESDMGTLFSMISILASWKGFGRLVPGDPLKQSRKSTVYVVCLALAHTIVWIYLGVILPSILSQGDASLVLVNGNNCSVAIPSKEQELNAQQTLHDLSEAGTNYYYNCYGVYKNGALPSTISDCNRLAHEKVLWTENVGECPFPGACKIGISPRVFDSGQIKPDTMGINSKYNRFSLRQVTTFVPLDPAVFIYNVEMPDEELGRIFPVYYLNFGSSAPELDSGLTSKYTVATPGSTEIHDDYVIINRIIMPNAGGPNNLKAHPTLQKPDASIFVLVINKLGVLYQHTNNDAIFAAHIPIKVVNSDTNLADQERLQNLETLYWSDEPIAVFGIADQFQICDSETRQCTGLGSLPDLAGEAVKLLERLDLDIWSESRVVCGFMIYMSWFSNTIAATIARGSDMLEIRNKGYYDKAGGIIQSVPDDQWIREARHWFGISMAKIHVLPFLLATNPTFRQKWADMGYTITNNPIGRQLLHLVCHNVKFRSLSHVTMNLIGLLFCLLISALIWLTSLSEEFVARRMFLRWPHKVLAWRLDSSMQMLRLLHQHMRAGTWVVTSDNDCPIAYGNIGLPYLVQDNGSEWVTSLTPAANEAARPLPDIVQNLSDMQLLSIVGSGWETNLKKNMRKFCHAVNDKAWIIRRKIDNLPLAWEARRRRARLHQTRQISGGDSDSDEDDLIDLTPLDSC